MTTSIAVGGRPTADRSVGHAGNGGSVTVGAGAKKNVADRRLAGRRWLNAFGVERTVIVTTQRRLLGRTGSVMVGHLGASDVRG